MDFQHKFKVLSSSQKAHSFCIRLTQLLILNMGKQGIVHDD